MHGTTSASRLEFATVMWTVAITVIAILACAVVATFLYLPKAMKASTIDAAYHGNLEVADQIKITRGYYTKNVVARALQTNSLKPSWSYKDDPNAIPLPATFVKDVSDLLREKETTLSLVSPYPWPHRASRKMDEFESRAWEAFQKDPTRILSQEDVQDGKRVLRVAIADVMTSKTCVDCHNGEPLSAKRDWKIGDVRAVMHVSKVIEPQLAAAEKHAAVILTALVVAALVAGAALVAVARVVQRRVRERRQGERRLEYLAHHDSLTGLANRSLLRHRLGKVLQRATGEHPAALLFLDLDRFKEINDVCGHHAGDELLRSVADRLRRCIGEGDVAARLGGDEFAVVHESTRSIDSVRELADRIIRELGQPYELSGNQVTIGVSVGISIAPWDGSDPEQLLRAADLAVYAAKGAGRGIYRFFEPDMARKGQSRRQLEMALRNALSQGEFELRYQPIFDLRSNTASGFEALLRWNHPTRGMISPAEFIPIAEETGLICAIGEWVLRQACRDAARWPARLSVAVNISPTQFRMQRGLAGVVLSALAGAGLTPHRLELEITESSVLQGNENTFDILRQVRACGVRIALDDFGTGYSSLTNLRNFSFDKIKIDRSFIGDLKSETSDAVGIIQSLVQLGESLGMETTAEGVETAEQLDRVRALGCTQAQGYFIAEPVPVHLIDNALRDELQAETAVRSVA